jgi:hypothetical protein
MVRGVGIAGNGMGLLNGQTTKRDSKLRRMGKGSFTFNTAGVKDKGPSCPKSFMELIRGFHDLLRQKPPSLLIL